MDIAELERQLENARAEFKEATRQYALTKKMVDVGMRSERALSKIRGRLRRARNQFKIAEHALLDAHRVPQPAGVGGSTQQSQPASKPAEEADGIPLEITPRLLFARWLVQTGRMTE